MIAVCILSFALAAPIAATTGPVDPNRLETRCAAEQYVRRALWPLALRLEEVRFHINKHYWGATAKEDGYRDLLIYQYVANRALHALSNPEWPRDRQGIIEALHEFLQDPDLAGLDEDRLSSHLLAPLRWLVHDRAVR